MHYGIGIGLGNTHTSVAILREGWISSPHLDGPAALVPTLVFVEPDGRIVCGEAAVARGRREPVGAARAFVERIGPGPAYAVGVGSASRTYHPQDIAAALVAWVVASITAKNETPPATVAIAHPADWHGHQIEAFRAALRPHGLSEACLVGEHLACGRVYSTFLSPTPGRPFAVLDVGGSAVRSAVLRTDVDGNVWPLGRPHCAAGDAGLEHDEALLATLLRALDPDGSKGWRTSAGSAREHPSIAGLRDAARRAKERLSHTARTDLVLELDSRRIDITITREALEEAIAASVARTIGVLGATLAAAGLSPDALGAVFLAGGAGQVPLLAAELSDRLGPEVLVAREADPALTAAAGAILSVEGLAATVVNRNLRSPVVETLLVDSEHARVAQPNAPRPARRTGPGNADPVRQVVAPREPTAAAATGRPIIPRRGRAPRAADRPAGARPARPTVQGSVIPPRPLGSVEDLEQSRTD